ncbi:nuclear pore complex protein nup133 [Anaeramoeba flamelloides]|uniref:Nuclear pore complex protein nup133 n=1 Tax=Anaeramoeba flamelloides TaxID=1746091 RepID=A0ABQ8Z4G8_9EUKA|nr:nuclear pore complex protein nup133 [Anaeramoeba flamelloides]
MFITPSVKKPIRRTQNLVPQTEPPQNSRTINSRKFVSNKDPVKVEIFPSLPTVVQKYLRRRQFKNKEKQEGEEQGFQCKIFDDGQIVFLNKKKIFFWNIYKPQFCKSFPLPLDENSNETLERSSSNLSLITNLKNEEFFGLFVCNQQGNFNFWISNNYSSQGLIKTGELQLNNEEEKVILIKTIQDYNQNQVILLGTDYGSIYFLYLYLTQSNNESNDFNETNDFQFDYDLKLLSKNDSAIQGISKLLLTPFKTFSRNSTLKKKSKKDINSLQKKNKNSIISLRYEPNNGSLVILSEFKLYVWNCDDWKKKDLNQEQEKEKFQDFEMKKNFKFSFKINLFEMIKSYFMKSLNESNKNQENENEEDGSENEDENANANFDLKFLDLQYINKLKLFIVFGAIINKKKNIIDSFIFCPLEFETNSNNQFKSVIIGTPVGIDYQFSKEIKTVKPIKEILNSTKLIIPTNKELGNYSFLILKEQIMLITLDFNKRIENIGKLTIKNIIGMGTFEKFAILITNETILGLIKKGARYSNIINNLKESDQNKNNNNNKNNNDIISNDDDQDEDNKIEYKKLNLKLESFESGFLQAFKDFVERDIESSNMKIHQLCNINQKLTLKQSKQFAELICKSLLQIATYYANYSRNQNIQWSNNTNDENDIGLDNVNDIEKNKLSKESKLIETKQFYWELFMEFLEANELWNFFNNPIYKLALIEIGSKLEAVSYLHNALMERNNEQNGNDQLIPKLKLKNSQYFVSKVTKLHELCFDVIQDFNQNKLKLLDANLIILTICSTASLHFDSNFNKFSVNYDLKKRLFWTCSKAIHQILEILYDKTKQKLLKLFLRQNHQNMDNDNNGTEHFSQMNNSLINNIHNGYNDNEFFINQKSGFEKDQDFQSKELIKQFIILCRLRLEVIDELELKNNIISPLFQIDEIKVCEELSIQFKIYPALIEIYCEKQNDYEKLIFYMEKFRNFGFLEHVFNYMFFQKKDYDFLKNTNQFDNELLQYLEENKLSLKWLQELKIQKYSLASKTLLNLSNGKNPLFLSLGKISQIVAIEEKKEQQKQQYNNNYEQENDIEEEDDDDDEDEKEKEDDDDDDDEKFGYEQEKKIKVFDQWLELIKLREMFKQINKNIQYPILTNFVKRCCLVKVSKEGLLLALDAINNSSFSTEELLNQIWAESIIRGNVNHSGFNWWLKILKALNNIKSNDYSQNENLIKILKKSVLYKIISQILEKNLYSLINEQILKNCFEFLPKQNKQLENLLIEVLKLAQEGL